MDRIGGLLALTALASSTAVAQQAPQGSNELTEIVVTAEKRAERIQDVPIAISVVSAQQLDQQHVYNIADLARTTPSLEMVQAFGGPGGGGQIRGIGTNSFSPTAEGAVGVVVDGVPQGNVNISNLFDIGQVEVLKGPQGTLFGLTASAGVINITTAAPDPTKISVNAHADYSDKGRAGSEFGEETIRGAVNLPLGDKAAVRLAVSDDRIKGVQTNNFNHTDTLATDWGARLRFLVHLTDNLDINVIGDYDRRGQNYSDPQFNYVSAASLTFAAELASCGITASYDNQARCWSNRNDTNYRNYGGSVQLDYRLEGMTLTAITGYRRLLTAPSDFDAQGLAPEFVQIFNVGAASAGRQVSQELRVTNSSPQALEYTAGLFYSSYSADSQFVPGCGLPTLICGGFFVGTFDLPPPSFQPANFPFTPFVHTTTNTSTTNRSEAVFGQVTYHLVDSWALLAGLRYTHQSLSADSDDPNTPGSATVGSLTENNWSGLLGVQYTVTPDVKSYFKVVRGYKGPQVTPAAEGSPQTVIGAEIPTMFELGIKGSSAQWRLNWDADVFYSRVHDYQGQSCSLNPVGALVCIGQSVSQVTTKGVELNLYGQLVRGLTFNAGYIYDMAKYPNGYLGYNPDDLRPAIPSNPLIGHTDLSGQQLVGVPKNKLSLSADYAFRLNDVVSPFVSADTVFKSAMRLGPSADPRFVYPKNWSTGLRIGVRSTADTWSVALFARNLGKDREPVTLFGGPSFIPPGAVPFLPNGAVNGISGWMTQQSLRQVGITAEVRF